MAGLAQSLKCLNAERGQGVASSFPNARPILRVLHKGNAFALQLARPLHGLDDHVKCQPCKIVFPISTFMQNTLTLKYSAFFCTYMKLPDGCIHKADTIKTLSS